LTHELLKKEVGYFQKREWKIDWKKGNEVYLKRGRGWNDIYIRHEKELTNEKEECTWIYNQVGMEKKHKLYFKIDDTLYKAEAVLYDELEPDIGVVFYFYIMDSGFVPIVDPDEIEQIMIDSHKRNIIETIDWFENKIKSFKKIRLYELTGNIQIEYSVVVSEILGKK
jgi:uncharacterized protein YrzB (UPF0473 family)